MATKSKAQIELENFKEETRSLIAVLAKDAGYSRDALNEILENMGLEPETEDYEVLVIVSFTVRTIEAVDRETAARKAIAAVETYLTGEELPNDIRVSYDVDDVEIL